MTLGVAGPGAKLVALITFLLGGCGASDPPGPIPLDATAIDVKAGQDDLWRPIRDDQGLEPDQSGPVAEDAGPAPDVQPSPCKASESHYQGHCYRAVAGTLTYGDAVQACIAEGMKIVAIESAGENQHVFEMLELDTKSAWIGLIRKSTGSTVFIWDVKMGGVAPTYLNWASGQPDNATGDENCVVIWGMSADDSADRAQWNDVPCASTPRQAAICERAL